MKNLFRFRLLFLALLAALGLAGAWWAVIADNQRQQKRYFEPELLFPSLAGQLDDIGAIRIDIGKGLAGVQHISFVRAAKDGQNAGDVFRIIERGEAIARTDLIHRLMDGLAGLEVIAPRAADREGHQRLGLIAPEELGPSVRIIFYSRRQSAGGKPRRKKIAGVLIGKRPENLGDVLGQSSVYVRRAGEKQSWLARGALPLRLNANEWLDFHFFKRQISKKIDGQDFFIAKAQFKPFGQASWRMTRPNKDRAFLLTDHRGIPLRGIVDDKRLAASARLLSNLVFQDVRPATDLKFRRQHTAIYESFSGLALVFEIIRDQRGYWARINARATARRAERLAQNFENQLDGQAFLLPSATARGMILPARAFFKKQRKKRKVLR